MCPLKRKIVTSTTEISNSNPSALTTGHVAALSKLWQTNRNPLFSVYSGSGRGEPRGFCSRSNVGRTFLDVRDTSAASFGTERVSLCYTSLRAFPQSPPRRAKLFFGCLFFVSRRVEAARCGRVAARWMRAFAAASCFISAAGHDWAKVGPCSDDASHRAAPLPVSRAFVGGAWLLPFPARRCVLVSFGFPHRENACSRSEDQTKRGRGWRNTTKPSLMAVVAGLVRVPFVSVSHSIGER